MAIGASDMPNKLHKKDLKNGEMYGKEDMTAEEHRGEYDQIIQQNYRFHLLNHLFRF